MSLLDIVFLAVALAMDCFAVSIVSGVIIRRWSWRTVLTMAVLFGVFQALMPLLGWFGMRYFSDYIRSIDHWIAFGLLAFVGIRMVRDSFGPEEEHCFNPRHFKAQVMLAIATSIDALAIGISFACIGYNSASMLVLPLVVIGVVSMSMSVIGHFLGLSCGRTIERRLRPELVGGIILILIGLKILITHLMGLE